MPAALTFDDEFNSLSLWNGVSGTWSTTYAFADPNGNGSSLPSNGEQEWYINANYAPTASVTPWTVANGVLTLTAAPVDPAIAPLLGYSQSGLPAMGSYQYTSGMIETNHSFTQTYGYFEMTAQLPAGQGTWPAFWLLPANGSWPPELDVMEVLGKDPSTLYTTAHTNQTGTHTSSGVGSVVANMSTGFHTYGVDWEPNTITWYFDNKPVYQVATPSDMNTPMYMVANLALGGSWGGGVDSTTPMPAKMLIDSIKAWSSNPYTYAPEGSSGPGQSFVGGQNDTLTGGSGDDRFLASLQGGERFTGGSGHDTYVWTSLPWVGDHISDFQVGSDKLDLHALYPTYSGSDPIRDGYVVLQADGHGGYNLSVNPDGHATTANPWPTFVVDLEGVTDVGLTSANLLVNGAAGQTAANTFSTSNTFQAVGTLGSTTTSPPPIINVAPFTLALSSASARVVSGTTGADTLKASGGDDIFIVNNTKDTIQERPLGGVDTAKSSIASFTLPGGVDNGVLTGSASQTLVGNSDSNDLVSNNAGSTLNGAGGNDILHAGRGADTLTGGAGSDVFQFGAMPTKAGVVTDFTPGQDVLDLRGLFATAGYHGGNPITDGYLAFRDDGQGGTQVWFDADGAGGAAAPSLITDLIHVGVTSLHAGSDWVFG